MCTKILYISEMDFDIKNGGAVASKEDLNILQKNYDVEKLIVPVTRRNFIRKILDLFTSQISTFYGRKTIKNIKKKIKNSGSDIIFFNNSIFGYLVKYASKLGKKTIVKFQNCEYILAKDCNRYWYYYDIYQNERKALKYSNHNIFLNSRDYQDIINLYKIHQLKYSIIPVGLKDEYDSNYLKNKEIENEIYGLFIGSYFKPNLEAIDFIYKNIKNIKGKIKIIGYKLESYLPKCENDKIELIGTVDTLTEYLINAKYMIFPIFSGSGMKIKTAQALMFGKEIFGTPEAFEGYEMLPNMHLCYKSEEFETEINKYLNENPKNFDEKARNYWLDNFSSEAVEEKLVHIIDSFKRKGD